MAAPLRQPRPGPQLAVGRGDGTNLESSVDEMAPRPIAIQDFHMD